MVGVTFGTGVSVAVAVGVLSGATAFVAVVVGVTFGTGVSVAVAVCADATTISTSIGSVQAPGEPS